MERWRERVRWYGMDEAIQMEDECMTGRKMITILIILVHACITSIIIVPF
jgi:hypothetical protein